MQRPALHLDTPTPVRELNRELPSKLDKILKKALEGRVPKELLYAPKRGFGYHIREEDVLRGAISTLDAARTTSALCAAAICSRLVGLPK